MNVNKHLTAQKLAEQLLDYPEQQWDQLIGEWCAGNEELQDLTRQIADQNRNARLFVEEFQKRVYSLTKSSLSAERSLPEEIAGFRILRKLGTGGSATVYMTENDFGERAALKLLRGIGPDDYSKQRFEAEQHILAALDHPNIARLIEGGITGQGDPFVLMEFVDGVPIDAWCDRHHLGIHERIRLFQQVCRAVHYAHQNLVVHRDLKPDHVLVTEQGEVKLIDFGIAKLLQPEQPEWAAFHTRTGMRIMTPEFASPEQVRGKHITTASDIYSLGVLLYLLLSGRKPYRIDTTSMLEIEKIVCEQQPVRPSEAVVDARPDDRFDPAESAGRRGTEPDRLQKVLSGDLDKIVFMAMWKEPDRRYASALSLSDDLDNFLSGEPVEARVPTLRYRAKKFIYRNKTAVTAAIIACLTLTVGIAGILWQAHHAKIHAESAEIQAERAEQVSAFLMEMFESSDPTKASDGSMTAREMLDLGFEKVQTELEGQPQVQAQMLGMIGKVYQNLGLYDQALSALEMAVGQFRYIGERSPLYASALLELANLEYRMGLLDQAGQTANEALELNRGFYGPDHPEIASVLNTLAIIYEGKGDMEEAKRTLRRVVEIRRQDPEPGSNLAANLNNLAILMHRTGELEGADELFEEAIDVVERIWGEIHPYMAYTLNGYSGVHQQLGNYDRAEEDLLRALDIGRTVFPPEHPFIAVVLHNLGKLFEESGDPSEALRYFEESLSLRLQSLPPTHPDLAASMDGAGLMFIELGQPAEAEKLLRKALEIRLQAYSEDDWRIAQVEAHLGRSLLHQDQFSEAEYYLSKSHQTLLKSRGGHDVHTQRAFSDLQRLYQQTGVVTEIPEQAGLPD